VYFLILFFVIVSEVICCECCILYNDLNIVTRGIHSLTSEPLDCTHQTIKQSREICIARDVGWMEASNNVKYIKEGKR